MYTNPSVCCPCYNEIALEHRFLSESSAPSKLRLVQYFFLDLAHASPPDQINHLVDNLVKFPSAFSLPPSLIKLTQVISASSLSWLETAMFSGFLAAGPRGLGGRGLYDA